MRTGGGGSGVVAIITHALNSAARSFYIKLGFNELEKTPNALYLRMKDARFHLNETR